MESEVRQLEVNIRPLKILDVIDGKLLAKSRKQLDFLLSNNADVPIHVISIFGNGCGGKSFLMNLLINYLKNDCSCVKGNLNFSSGFFMNSETGYVLNNVYVYPEIFIKKTVTDEKFGILLMEIRGFPDGKFKNLMPLQFKVCKTLSSVMILNIKEEKIPISSLLNILEQLIDDQKIANHTHLIFLLRDSVQHKIMNVPIYSDTLEIIVQDLNKQIGEKIYRDLKEKFADLTYYMVPKPSKIVISGKFTGDTQRLPGEFLKVINHLFNKITIKNQQLLNGSQLATIFRHMTQLSAVQWSKFCNAFRDVGGNNFLVCRPIDKPKSLAPSTINKTNKKKNKMKLKPKEDGSTVVIGNLIDLNGPSISAGTQDDSSTDDMFESVSRQEYNSVTNIDDESCTTSAAKSLGVEQQSSTNHLVKDWLDKLSQTTSDTHIDFYQEKLNQASSYYSSLKNATVREVELISNIQMAAMLCCSNALNTYRDLCKSIIQDTYKISTKHNTPEIYCLYKDELRKEIIEKTYKRAIRLAIEDYKKRLLDDLNIDGLTRSDIKVVHFEYKPIVTTIFQEFWNIEKCLDELNNALEQEYFSVVKEICQNKLQKQLNSITDVNNLFDVHVAILKEFFPPFAWLDPNNKIDKAFLEKSLMQKVADKAVELLKKDCEQKFSRRLRSDNYSRNIVAFFDSIKDDAVCVMRNIDESRIDDLIKELQHIKDEYDLQSGVIKLGNKAATDSVTTDSKAATNAGSIVNASASSHQSSTSEEKNSINNDLWEIISGSVKTIENIKKTL